MISLDDLHILCEEQTKDLIDRNIERKHSDVALDKSLHHRVLVAGQVKYLQRAKSKLPHYYEARCIIPDRAFEQSSSEATAECKVMEGESVLELCCGLGVDSVALSRKFKRVVTLERDEVLAEVARENFRRLRVANIEVVSCSAEEYIERCEERFDWIYADPDRRDGEGRKRVVLEECSPNILALYEWLKRVSERLVIKCSPLFDVDEAWRLFPGSSVEVVSVGGECKEVVIYIGMGGEEMIGATAIGRGSVWITREGDVRRAEEFNLDRYRYILIPDVALQKGRIARRLLSEVCDIWSDNGYGFLSEGEQIDVDPARHLSRMERIEWGGDYNPKVIRKILAERGVKSCEIMKRDFRWSVDQIKKQLKIREGGGAKLLFTTINGRDIALLLS